MLHRIARTACVGLSVTVLTVAVARSADAECYPNPFHPGAEVCQICNGQGQDCCYTYWIDDQLVDQWGPGCPVLPTE
jgi:hypothetical protein